jgi:hypothetical protein
MTTLFNRHELFDTEMIQFHSHTIRLVEEYYLYSDIKTGFNAVVNMLYGIWDGYLYDELLPLAVTDQVPAELISRIQTTIDFIQK